MFVSQGLDKEIEEDGPAAQAVPPADPVALAEDQRHDYIYRPEGAGDRTEVVRSVAGMSHSERGAYDG